MTYTVLVETLNPTHSLTEGVADVIIPLHVITGSGHTSGFYGCSKKQLLQKVISDQEATELLRRVDESLELRNEVKSDVKTCW